jgi:pyridoxine 4-dehydrogenase
MPTKTIRIGGDLEVNRLGFGAMRLSGESIWHRPADRANSIAVARRAVELGVTFIDTADSYGIGDNEELLAEALHPYADDLVIATKAGQSRPAPTRWVPLGRPEYLRQQAELSLRRLRLDRIDLFYLHRVDPHIPLADQIGALADLRSEGKIRHIGLSEVTVEQLREAQAIVPIASVQSLYSVADRHWEDMLEVCEAEGIAFVPWGPIGRDGLASADSVVAQVAKAHGTGSAGIGLAWLLRRSPVVLPIPGTHNAEHLESNVAAGAIELTDTEFEELSAVAS